MKTVGIIAEYNPFHRGHEYQIREIRKQTGAEHIVAVMSGDFVQRGTPAWTDKFLRTEMALVGGADMVFELPVPFAAASAEVFAYGAVSLLEQLGFVDGICFGSECGDLDALSAIAEYLVTQEKQIHKQMQDKLSHGYTYPAARAELLSEAFPHLLKTHPDLLTGSNNILAIEYLKALFRMNSSITPLTITRQGSAYHSNSMEQNPACHNGSTRQEPAYHSDSMEQNPACHDDSTCPGYASALAIRTHYAQTGSLPPQALPRQVYEILKNHPCRFPITLDDFSDMLYYKLRSADDSALSVLDMTPALWQRIRKQLPGFQTISQFTELIKTKQYTQTRIQRVFLHLLLDLHPGSSTAAYARLLGFRQAHSSLLRTKTGIPVLTKVADAETVLKTPEVLDQLSTDRYAHDLYRYVLQRKFPQAKLPDDYHASPVII